MAKGCEDTAFYVYNRLLSLNEVGGAPARFGRPPADVHRFLAARAERFPHGLSPLATHDTKRGEDVRARLNVLTEMPGEWGRRIARWRDLNLRHKMDLGDDLLAPDSNDEYLLYQTLVGTRPLGPDEDDRYAARIVEYMHKAVHEAKVHSSWINHEPDYHAAVDHFVGASLDPNLSAEFLADLDAFTAEVARAGMINSLAQTLIRCTAPGTPDTYQGTELWDLHLVDPDNRQPVDFARRQELLQSFEAVDRSPLNRAKDLVAHLPDGRIKMFTLAKALQARREQSDLFAAGEYVPVTASGPAAKHVFAFLRVHEARAALIVVPRLLAGRQNDFFLGQSGWADTVLHLPDRMPREWTHVLTGERVDSVAKIPVGVLLRTFPVALLIGFTTPKR
jgi:(1->4)-alpha-D-glucan 1-alpha-D-glucosylmutase